jgi:hypothetical protein
MRTGPRLFTLASVDDKYEIYMVGIAWATSEPTGPRWSHIGVHPSAESALPVYRRVGDLQLIWDDDRLARH